MAAPAEFEVEDILRYRRSDDGEEYFFVKWVGYSAEEATWEPLGHMNDNCRELVAKARALFAWRKPSSSTVSPASEGEPASRTSSDSQASVLGVDNEDETAGRSGAGPLKRRAEGPPAAAAPAPSKRPKVPSAPNGAAASPPASSAAPTPPPAPPQRKDDGPPPRPKEYKCICGAADKVTGASRGNYLQCSACHSALHPACVKGVLRGQPVPADFVCPQCRLERVDEFHPIVGQGLLCHRYSSSSSTVTLAFTAQANQWRKQQWAVHLRAVLVNTPSVSGPGWPHRVTGKLNAKPCVAIDPPKHLHVRREQCYNLTPLLRQGPNTLDLKFTPNPGSKRDESEEMYCVGVVLTRPRSVASIIARIRTRSTETVSSGRQRVERLLAQVAWSEAREAECQVTGHFGRTLRPHCPVSHCPIEDAAIGKGCNHVQVFDLQSYVAVNQRMRSLDKRWTCPVCAVALRPDDVILDPFAQGILDTVRGDEDLVEAIVFNEDCTWSTVSAVKEGDKEGGGGDDEAGGGQAAELIDLSDSE